MAADVEVVGGVRGLRCLAGELDPLSHRPRVRQAACFDAVEVEEVDEIALQRAFARHRDEARDLLVVGSSSLQQAVREPERDRREEESVAELVEDLERLAQDAFLRVEVVGAPFDLAPRHRPARRRHLQPSVA